MPLYTFSCFYNLNAIALLCAATVVVTTVTTAYNQFTMLRTAATATTHLWILLDTVNSAQHGQHKCCSLPCAWLSLGYHVTQPATELQLLASWTNSQSLAQMENFYSSIISLFLSDNKSHTFALSDLTSHPSSDYSVKLTMDVTYSLDLPFQK
jgi:hypothetical protein